MGVDWNLYKSRIDMYGYKTKSGMVDYMNNSISDEFEMNPSYYLVLKNSTNANCWVVDESAINKNPNKKRIIMKPDEDISVGDLITISDWNNSNWLCTNCDPDNEIYNSGIIEKCNNQLNFMIAATPYTYPCIIMDKSSQYSDGTDAKEYLVLVDDQILVIVSEDDYTSTLKPNNRFIFNNKYSFLITKINNLTQTQRGLLYLTMKFVEKSENDDFDNNLPDDTVYTIPDNNWI